MSFPEDFLSLLISWWASFTPAEQFQFEQLFGGTASLLTVTVPSEFLPAVVKFWVPALCLFRFGLNELTPTIEEYHFSLRMRPSLENIIRHAPNKNARNSFSSLTGLKKSCLIVDEIDGIPTIRSDFIWDFFGNATHYNPQSSSFTRLGDSEASSRRRLYAFAFVIFAGLFFPRSDGLLDLRVSF